MNKYKVIITGHGPQNATITAIVEAPDMETALAVCKKRYGENHGFCVFNPEHYLP